MLNEDQRALKQIQHRMTSLTSSAESFRSSLHNLSQTSELSQELLLVAEVTSEFLLLMTEGLAVLQSETDRLYWINGSTRWLSLKQVWRTAYESLYDWAVDTEVDETAEEDCECSDDDPLISPY